MERIIIGLLLIFCSSLLPATELFRCESAGRTVFQDRPCAPGTGDLVELSPINQYGAAASESLPAGGKAVGPLPVGADWHRDADGYAAALAESARFGRPVLVYFYADWCPHCRHFDSKVLPDAAVSGAMGQFVKVRLNIEKGSREAGIFRLLGGRGTPHLVVQGGGVETITLRGTGEAREFARALSQVKALASIPR